MCKLWSKQHCCHLFKTKVHLNENTWHPLRFLYLLPCTVCTSLAYSSPRDESLYYLLISTVVLQITTLLPQQAALCCRDVPSHNCELCIGCEVGLRVAIVKVKILLNESQLLKWPFNVILNHHWLHWECISCVWVKMHPISIFKLDEHLCQRRAVGSLK